MDQPILTINGGSSSIKFALFSAGNPPTRSISGQIERIGQPGTILTASIQGRASERQSIDATDHSEAVRHLMDWIELHLGTSELGGIGHRVVHGGLHLRVHQIITPEVIEELRRTQPLDEAHLPREIALIEAFGKRFPTVRQVACFDTAFHRDMPRLAQLLPIPRKYDAAGLRRFGFHGISYSYLLEELGRVAGERAANGRIIFAHLGSGASMAAVKDGKPIETTMAFTPLAGLVMGTRPGDLDPGLLIYLMRVEKMSVEQIDAMLNQESGLKGISQTSSDMRDLTERRASDVRASEAVDLFCYRARQWIGALAATMGGLDTLVFSGGIGEHAPEVRAEICRGLEFLGLKMDEQKNKAAKPSVISTVDSRVNIRVIPTDEEIMIAKTVARMLEEHPIV